MKTIQKFLLSFVALSLLISCVPGDPEVLSPEERARENSWKKKRNERNDRGNGSGAQVARVEVPGNVELPMAVLIEARHDQALQVLRQALALVRTNAEVIEEGCVRTEFQAESDSVWIYQIFYQECPMSSGKQKFVFSGAARLQLKMARAGHIQSLAFTTPTLDQESFNESSRKMTYQMVGDASLIVEDQVAIEMEQTEKNLYKVSKLISLSRVTQGPEDNVTTFMLPIESSDTVYKVKPSGEIKTQYMTVMKGKASNTAGGKVTFDLEVAKKFESPNLHYSMKFNEGNARKGQIELTETEIILAPEPKNGRPVDKVKKTRQKSSEFLDGIMPWDFWYLEPKTDSRN